MIVQIQTLIVRFYGTVPVPVHVCTGTYLRVRSRWGEAEGRRSRAPMPRPITKPGLGKEARPSTQATLRAVTSMSLFSPGSISSTSSPGPSSEGLKSLFRVLETNMKTSSFQKNMARTFVSLGQAPQEDGSFVRWTGKNKVVHSSILGSISQDDSLGGLLVDAQLRHEDQRSDAEDNDESSSDSGDDDVVAE